MKFKLIQFDVILLCFTFYEITMLPHAAFLGFKYAVLSYLLIRYIPTANRMPAIIIPAAAFGLVNVLSSYMNHLHQKTIISSLFFAIQVAVIFLVTENYLEKYPLKEFARTVLIVFVFWIVITDGLMLVRPYKFYSAVEEYFIGNKFVVSYIHCFASALLFLIGTDDRKIISLRNGQLFFSGMSMRLFAYLFTAFSVLVCIRVTCSTGMICCMLLIVMMIIPDAVKRFFSSGKIMIIITSALNLLFFGASSILNNPVFENFVYGTLGKSSSWTGRLIIWKAIFKLIGKKPIIGYGFYSDIVNKTVDFGNPQNAVLKFLIDVGIVGLVLFGVLVWVSFRNIKGDALKRIYPMAAFMYPMISASLVEINLTHMIVFMAMAIAYSGTKYTPGRKVNENRNTLNATSS